MIKVEKTNYPGWSKFPVYRCAKLDDYHEVVDWMYRNESDPFLLSSGSTGYVFQVRENHDWFLLRWA